MSKRQFARFARFALFAGLFVALVSGGFTVWLLRQDHETLLAHATPLVSTQDWQPRDPRMRDYEPYEWISDHEVLFVKRDAAGKLASFLLDVTTRREQELHDPFPTPAKVLPQFPAVSPDGKLLLWSQTTRNDTACILTDRNGKILRSWPKAPNGGCVWLPDNRGFATRAWVNGREHLYIHHVDSAAIEAKPLATAKYFYHAGTHFMPNGHLFGMSEVITAGQSTGKRNLVEHDANGTLLRESPLPMPGGERFARPIYFSPESDRIVWDTSGLRMSPTAQWLWKQLPFLPFHPRYAREFWVSRLDGTNLHLAGKQTDANVRDSLGAARVLPDGKRLSFLYRDRLYTVPLD